MLLLSTLLTLFSMTGSLPDNVSRLPGTVAWTDLGELQITEQRPMLIWLHTDWCQFCQGMKHRVWPDTDLQDLLQDQYYFLELNGEAKDPISFGGEEWTYRPTGPTQGTHRLAEALGTIDGQLSYPTLVLLSAEYEIIGQYGGFLSKKRLLKILQQALGD